MTTVSRVEVMNTDFVFRLFLGNPQPAEVDEMLRLVELPYPVGLMTPVGAVVANPAPSKDPRHWKELGRDAYHGAVMWSWQGLHAPPGPAAPMGALPRGPLAGSARRPTAPRPLHPSTPPAVRAGALASSELWTWEIHGGKVRAMAFGQRAGSETESNAVQLWSTIFPRHSGTP